MNGWVPYGRLGWFREFGSVDDADTWQEALTAADPETEVRRGWSSLLIVGPTPPTLGSLVGDMTRTATRDVGGDAVVVPVRYDGDDLAEVAERAGMSVGEVIERHTAPTYRVVMLGFTRGFPYLAGSDPALHLPRRPSPRARVPAGSVAIAGAQTGIYPSASPGGWHLLGRTDLAVFDVDRDPPNLLAPGARVRFEAVDR